MGVLACTYAECSFSLVVKLEQVLGSPGLVGTKIMAGWR